MCVFSGVTRILSEVCAAGESPGLRAQARTQASSREVLEQQLVHLGDVAQLRRAAGSLV